MLDISYLSDSKGDMPSYVLYDKDFKQFSDAFFFLKKNRCVD